MKEKLKTWEKIKERNINIPFKKQIYELIEKNMDRIEFVKDHIGLRDFLFLAEEDTQYVSNLFISLNVNIIEQINIEQNEEMFREKLIMEPEKVMAQLKNFFEKTDRVLGVGIGFIECNINDSGYLALGLAMMTGKIKSIHEGLRAIRQFPQWYSKVAKMPEEIKFTTRAQEEHVSKEEIEETMNEIMKKIDILLSKKQLTEEEKIEFEMLSNMYRNLQKFV